VPASAPSKGAPQELQKRWPAPDDSPQRGQVRAPPAAAKTLPFWSMNLKRGVASPRMHRPPKPVKANQLKGSQASEQGHQGSCPG